MTIYPSSWNSWSQCFDGIQLPIDFFDHMDIFLFGIENANKSINLVSYQTTDDLRGHVADSIQALRAPDINENPRVIDVGTGGGFPGVPLALARPQWTVHLLDSTRKKQSALSTLAKIIPNVRSLWGRAEAIAQPDICRESYDLALCRAVGWLTTVLEFTLPLVKIGGMVLLHRGNDAPNELSDISAALKKLGGKPGPLIRYKLPGFDKERYIVCFEKISPTDIEYPRRPGIPAKRPLK